jgi:nitroimidazol reductase NimA-like FMN-containing flavoprotein (pyridoxamine 5'-phosphate oxidase superfamily)
MKIVSGPWDEARVERWLTEARIPVRLGVTAPTGPLVVSMWYRFADGALWCATGEDADVVTHVRRHPRVGFEIGPDVPPYRGVRGTAEASIVPERGAATLERLLERYLDDANAGLADWLRDGADDEVALRLDDLHIASWDFSGRMAAQEPGPILPDLR